MSAPLPCLVLVVGVSCTAKTRVARYIARNSRFIYLDSERIKRQVGEESMVAKPSPTRSAAYEELNTQIFHELARGRSVVTDAPHTQEVRDPRYFQQLEYDLANAGVDVNLGVIWMHKPEAMLRHDMDRRKRSSDRWKLVHWQEFLETEYHPFRVTHPHLKLIAPFELEKAVNYVKKLNR